MCQLLGVSARLPGNATRKLCVGDDYYLWFSGLALDEMLTDGEQRELETIGDVKLVVNPRQVMLHRLLTERESLRHFLVAVAGSDRGDDFELARREPELRFRRREHLRAKRFDEPRHAFAADPVLAGHDHAHRLHEQLGGGILHHEATRPELQRLDDLVALDVGRREY